MKMKMETMTVTERMRAMHDKICSCCLNPFFGLFIFGFGLKKTMPQPNPNNYGSGHDRSIQRADAPTEFTWTKEPEPHVGRRREILKKYPQIKELYQPDPVSAIFGAVTVVLQIVMCYLVS